MIIEKKFEVLFLNIEDEFKESALDNITIDSDVDITGLRLPTMGELILMFESGNEEFGQKSYWTFQGQIVEFESGIIHGKPKEGTKSWFVLIRDV